MTSVLGHRKVGNSRVILPGDDVAAAGVGHGDLLGVHATDHGPADLRSGQ